MARYKQDVGTIVNQDQGMIDEHPVVVDPGRSRDTYTRRRGQSRYDIASPEEERNIPPTRTSLFSSSFGGMSMPTLNMNLHQAETREVTDDELVENRLTNLLRSDNKYIQQARRDGAAIAAERGALNSSMFADHSQAAAIRAAGAVAESDANAYRMAASENMAAKNALINNKLAAATQITTAGISAGATVRAAEINAEASIYMQELQQEHQKAMAQMGHQFNVDMFDRNIAHDVDMFGRTAGHDTFMERLRQEGRIELTDLTYSQQRLLQAAGFDHDLVMSELSFDQKVALEETFGDPRFHAQLDFNRTTSQMQAGLSLMNMYSSIIMSMNGLDMDSAAFARGEEFASSLYDSGLQLLKGLWGDDFDFNINFGGGG